MKKKKVVWTLNVSLSGCETRGEEKYLSAQLKELLKGCEYISNLTSIKVTKIKEQIRGPRR